MRNKIILTDCDGVSLDWEYAFDVWMREHGFNKQEGWQFKYDMGRTPWNKGRKKATI